MSTAMMKAKAKFRTRKMPKYSNDRRSASQKARYLQSSGGHCGYLCGMEWMFTLNEVNAVAREFLGIVHDGSVIAFHGEMGSGKTTFIKALCHEMNVKDVVGSPTYSLIN